MQDRIYRFLVKRSVRGGVFEAHDTVADTPVLLYEWTPPIDERAQARARLEKINQDLDAEVFSADASLYLVASTDDQARRALQVLNREGLFPSHLPSEEPTPPPPVASPPPPPPSPPPQRQPQAAANPPAPRPLTPEYTPVRGPSTAPPPAPPRRKTHLTILWLVWWSLLITILGIVAYAIYQGTRPTPPATLVLPPTLTVDPKQAHPGDRVNLIWSTTGYEEVQLEGQRVDNAGNRILTATSSRTFHLVARTASGERRTAQAHLTLLPSGTRSGKPNAGAKVTPTSE